MRLGIGKRWLRLTPIGFMCKGGGCGGGCADLKSCGGEDALKFELGFAKMW